MRHSRTMHPKLSATLNRRIDRILKCVVDRANRHYFNGDESKAADKRTARSVARFKFAIAQLEHRASHWREIANTRARRS